MKSKPNKRQVREMLWRRGNLQWKLRDYQKPIYEAIRGSDSLKFMLNCSRRLGKTTVMAIIVIEEALRTDNGLYQFTTATLKDMRGIIKPIFRDLLQDCPDDIKPQYNGKDDFYFFPSTGSEIHLAGSNNGHEDDSRGRRRNKCFVDEGQQIDNLKYLIDSVLAPQTIDQSDGQIIVAGTPPESPEHYFKQLYLDLKTKDAVAEYTVYDNTTLTPEKLDEYAEEAGGYESTTWKREYEAKFVVDSERAIIPEWSQYERVVANWEPTPLFYYYHTYTAMDIGTSDYTAILLAYYDFERATLVIMEEWHESGTKVTTSTIKQAVETKEKEVFPGKEAYRRVADNNNKILLHDLYQDHGILFSPTSKDNLHAMVNKVREWVKSGRIEVHQRCKMLLANLEGGIWDKNREKFARFESLGHMDHLAALVYLVRNIDVHTNPIPKLHGINLDNHHIPPEYYKPRSNSGEALKQLFNK